MIYIVLFFYTIIFAYFFSKRRKSISEKFTKRKLQNLVLFILLVLPSIVVAGIRYGISVDYTRVYERGYYLILNSVSNSEFEIGFSYLVRLCSYLIKEPWFMFFIVSMITIVVYFIAFENSSNYFLSVILFFGAGVYFDSYNGIRQYIVCAIFLYCIKYIKSGDWRKYFLIMGICITLHTSAAITLPLFFLRKIRINKIYCIILASLMMVFSKQLYNLIVIIMSSMPKYSMYIVRNTIESQISLSASGIIMAIIALIPCFFAEKVMFKTEEGKFFYNMMMVGLIIAVSTSFLPFAERLLYYTRTCILLAVPFACESIVGKKKYLIKVASVSSTSFMNFWGIFLLNWYAVLPYCSIFSK